ncbi:MAG: sulfur transferase domain-containing protein [Candidatus Andersenbacteria bacterium]|nr:sulfur transferase domain-containing protein [bacterium]MDZ4225490.1 sulfur transferase domain-containing protein [Candidatus Andersenbacteria bacterium]
MKGQKIYVTVAVVVVLLAAGLFLIERAEAPTDIESSLNEPSKSGILPIGNLADAPTVTLAPEIKFVGPREGIPEDAPVAYGFWSFAMPVPGVLSRSGQPLIGEFEWLRQQGWRGVVDLRVDGERDEVGDDRKLPGFDALGFNYLALPIIDGHPPTDEQAEQFLTFVTDAANQPVHVHCRGGIGRAGTMVALYRYAVQGWPLDKAIEESRAFQGGISEMQKTWLEGWAAEHPNF